MLVFRYNMKKNLTILVISLLLIQFAVLPVKALEIVINESGTTYFYEDKVLGETSESKSEARGEQKQEVRTEKPIKVVPRSNAEQIRVKANKNETEVILEKGKEVTKSERVEIELPAQLRENKLERREELSGTQDGTQAGKRKAPEQLKEDRKKRSEEQIQLRSTKDESTGETVFEFESRLMKAKARGAEFVLDPATNNVTVITPNGTQHTLTHLPDQALMQMQAAGLLTTDGLVAGDEELTLEAKDDGSVVYSKKVKKTKKILGMFNREIETEVELDDQTGQVTEEEVPASSALGRWLNSLAR